MKHHKLLGWLGLISLSATLAACGGGDDPAGADSGAGSASSARVAEAPVAAPVAQAAEAAPLVSAPVASAVPAEAVATSTTTASPVDTGPALENPAEVLDAALACSPGFADGTGTAVLLVPGATQTPESEYSWTYIPAFNKAGIRWCAVKLPFSHTGELQNSSEYVTHAIRKMFAKTGKKIAIVGFSQGGALPRWSLKYFPDTRAMVEDFISLGASNRGLLSTRLSCPPVVGALTCPVSFSQISTGSKWIAALNRGPETFAGIDYTQVYTRTEDVAFPAISEEIGVSPLRTGDGRRANIATQDVCLTNTADHFLLGTSDPVAYALVLDALKHEGPASTARVRQQGLGLCLQPFMPGVNPLTFALDFSTKTMLTFATSVALQPKTSSEPPLKPYVTF